MSRGPWKSKQNPEPIEAAPSVTESVAPVAEPSPVMVAAPVVAQVKSSGVQMISAIPDLVSLHVFGAVYVKTDGAFRVAREHVEHAKAHGLIEKV